MRRLCSFGVLALCLLAPPVAAQGVTCSPLQEPYFDALGIHTDFAEAAKVAQDESKPLVLLFSVQNVRRPGFQ